MIRIDSSKHFLIPLQSRFLPHSPVSTRSNAPALSWLWRQVPVSVPAYQEPPACPFDPIHELPPFLQVPRRTCLAIFMWSLQRDFSTRNFFNYHNHSTLLFTSDPSESILSIRQKYRLCVHINKYRQQMIHFRIETPRFFVLEHAPTLYGRHSYLRTALEFLNTNLLST